MRLYTAQHAFYCGIDLHAQSLHACVVDQQGEKRLHRSFPCQAPERLFAALASFGSRDLVIGCESTFNWYWLADACRDSGYPFILGHALYLRAIHGGKTKSDAIDSEKLARLLRGGNFPLAHVYPRERRATRDLLRRRTHLVRRRAEALTHIQLLHLQHNFAKPGNCRYKANRIGIDARVADPSDRLSLDVDLQLIAVLDEQIRRLESHLQKTAKVDDVQSYYRLQTVPGIGPTLAMTILYEAGDISRFPKVGDFLSYARLVAGSHTSAGKKYGSPGRKIGNPHLRWAFAEAVTLFKRESKEASDYCARVEKKYGKARSLSVLGVKLGRSVYHMLRKQEAFELARMFS